MKVIKFNKSGKMYLEERKGGKVEDKKPQEKEDTKKKSSKKK